jgi:hypothetical protein
MWSFKDSIVRNIAGILSLCEYGPQPESVRSIAPLARYKQPTGSGFFIATRQRIETHVLGLIPDSRRGQVEILKRAMVLRGKSPQSIADDPTRPLAKHDARQVPSYSRRTIASARACSTLKTPSHSIRRS